MLPQVIKDGIKFFNDSVHSVNQTHANNPFQFFTGFASERWLAVSDLLKFNAKGQNVILPLVDSSRFNCWDETFVCEKLNDPNDPLYKSESQKAKLRQEATP